MIELFKWLPDLASRLNGTYGEYGSDFGEYYRDYLQNTDICSTVFLWGMVVTAVIAAAYYFVGCNRWYRVANRGAWLVMLLFACALSFGITYTLVLGNDAEEPEERTGVYSSADTTRERLREGIEDEDTLTSIDDICDAYRKQYSDGTESLPMEMGSAMALYSFILFLILSIVFKKYTIHGVGIPL